MSPIRFVQRTEGAETVEAKLLFPLHNDHIPNKLSNVVSQGHIQRRHHLLEGGLCAVQNLEISIPPFG